jgi:glycosyltransferase involved in cell wall biosynthesis
MRIGIDMMALLPEHTGVDVSIINLVMGLAEVDAGNRYFLFVNLSDRRYLRKHFPENFTLIPIATRSRIVRLVAQQIVIPFLAMLLWIDVVHSPAFIMPIVRGRSRHVLTIHDMTFFTLPEYHSALRSSRLYRRIVLLSINLADKICVPSVHVRNELLRIAPNIPGDRVRVIRWGIGDEFTPRTGDEVAHTLKALGIHYPYILHVGTIEPRKNLPFLLSSYEYLLQKFNVNEHLVFAGRLGWNITEFLEAVDRGVVKGRVHVLGYVDKLHLVPLYSGARLCVYPSLEEGFGFPPLEAMACGVPVIASDSSSLSENLKGAAELVDPDDTQALGVAMVRLLDDDTLRKQRIDNGLQRAAQFSWGNTARNMLGCYRELACIT